ncbi:Ku protein [Puia sp. P3]|uniref:non-homologous end joining protein Ku n=1 Tax=Puia sp. P3 TaxID=3423952 RepID=UPI003D67837B
MRSIWTGAIGFGLVNIPIKMYSAVQGSELDLDMLDKKDHSNIRFKRVNEKTGKEVAWENIIKGYKLNDQYVILTDEDFAKASPEKSKIIEINEFVEETKIDSIYYETPYYLEPDKSGAKAYALLREALHKTGKVGFGSFVLRNKEGLCLIKPMENILVLCRIRWARGDPRHRRTQRPRRQPQTRRNENGRRTHQPALRPLRHRQIQGHLYRRTAQINKSKG